MEQRGQNRKEIELGGQESSGFSSSSTHWILKPSPGLSHFHKSAQTCTSSITVAADPWQQWGLTLREHIFPSPMEAPLCQNFPMGYSRYHFGTITSLLASCGGVGFKCVVNLTAHKTMNDIRESMGVWKGWKVKWGAGITDSGYWLVFSYSWMVAGMGMAYHSIGMPCYLLWFHSRHPHEYLKFWIPGKLCYR